MERQGPLVLDGHNNSRQADPKDLHASGCQSQEQAGKTHEKRFRETIDIIQNIFGPDLAQSEFRAIRLFYPLFCAICHFKHRLPKLKSARKSFRVSDYPKMKTALEYVDDLLEEAESNKADLSAEDAKFYDAYDVHWVHSDKRIIATEFLCKKLSKALED